MILILHDHACFQNEEKERNPEMMREKEVNFVTWGIPERTGSRNPASWELNRRRELCPQLWQKEHHGQAKLQQKTRESRKSSPKPWMQ